MNVRCKNCPLLFCDYISRGCPLTPAEIVKFRPDLIGITFNQKMVQTAKQRADANYYQKNRRARIEKADQWNKEHPDRRKVTNERYRQQV